MRYAGLAASFVFFLLFSSLSSVSTFAATAADNTYCGPGDVARFGSGLDGPASLPHRCIYTALSATPSPGPVRAVAAGANLQTVLNAAQCGDTISLQAGATFTGNFTLPAKPCDSQHWITIRTSAPDSSLPPEGTRLTPCYSGVSSLPGGAPFACSQSKNVTAKLVYPTGGDTSGPVAFATGANHYRLIGLEVTRAPATGGVMELVLVRMGGTANHIIIDRSWLHGLTHEETARGVYLTNMSYTAIIDSYLSDFHCAVKGKCADSQAIAGGGADAPTGPYKVVNNFLEAAAENILFGAAASTQSPSDIEIRRNHLFKRLNWLAGEPGFVGGPLGTPFIVKNHFELKNAQRVLFEGNILENNWGGFSQNGFSILLTPKSQNVSGVGTCPMCQVTDITLRFNRVSHSGAGFQLATAMDSIPNAAALAGTRFSIHDMTIDDINKSRYHGSGTLFLLLNGWPSNVLNNVTVEHITGFPDPGSHVLSIGNATSKPKMAAFNFVNNIVGAGRYPVWSALASGDCAAANIPVKVLPACFSSYTLRSNVLVSSPTNYPVSAWPSGNFFSATTGGVGFLSGSYMLSPSSRYKSAGDDGRDPGADVGAINKYTAGVL